MSWQARRMEIFLGSDLHCGDLPLGFVARTLPFVPGALPWYALVPTAVLALGLPDVRESYQRVERLFQRALRLTPLYVRDGDRDLFPWRKKDQAFLESHYLGSHYGVGLDDDSRSARDGQLFETEVLLAAPRREPGSRETLQPTRLCGYLFWRADEVDGLALDDDGNILWQDAKVPLASLLTKICLGGNRTRGFGRIARATLASCDGTVWQDFLLLLDGAWPGLAVAPGKDVPLPLQYTDSEVRGELGVMLGRRFASRGPGLDMDEPIMVWKAGWQSGKETMVELKAYRAASLANMPR